MLKYVAIGLVCMVFIAGGQAQNWGEMQLVNWFNSPYTFCGYLNPSYCDAESLLYLDFYHRESPDGDSLMIYTSKFDSIYADYRYWSDPQPLPAPINIAGCHNVMANINRSNDTLFFSSNRDGSIGGMDIWMSVKENGLWQEPINLGDSINTIHDELKPYYASQSKVLFFERMSWGPLIINIYKSDYVDSHWQSAERLPDIINVPEDRTVGPFYDEQERALYYTNYQNLRPINNIKKSYLVEGEWQDPEELTDNINGFFVPNYCNFVTTECIFLSFDRQFAFYDKQTWEVTFCADFWYVILLSERMPDNIEDESGESTESADLFEIFPNPSNSRFSFEFPQLKNEGVLRIYNISGQLVDEFQLDANDGYVLWDGTDRRDSRVASGVYFAVLEDGAHKISRQFVLLK